MKRIVLLSMICLVAITSTAQSISGCVIDEQAQPMPFANVVLVNRADSAFIAGTRPRTTEHSASAPTYKMVC